MTDLEIRYFLEIVDQGISFTKASQTLYVSQPALTKHINTLSKELGVKLIDTSKKNAARLTPAGELYYNFFNEAKDQFKKIKDEAKVLAGEYYGELFIGCLGGWNMMPLLPQKKAFCDAYPHVSVSLHTGGFKEIKTGLLNNNYDLLVAPTIIFQGMANICIHDIFYVPWILLFSREHPLAGKENPEIFDFKDDTFYCISEEDTPNLREDHVSYCKSKGFIPNFKPLPNLESILLAIQTGTGYTILDNWVRQKDEPVFRYFLLDKFLTIGTVWKADNLNKALPLFLKTSVYNLPSRQ